MKNIFPLIGLCTAVTLLVAPPVQASPTEFETVDELMAAGQVADKEVTTRNHAEPHDGISVTYSISPDQPQGAEGGAAVRLANGQWAVPTAEPLYNTSQTNDSVAQDLITRGRSFVEAGQDLKWNDDKATPLSDKVIHKEDSKPYGVTCSSFIAMVMQGWEYDSTTYVKDSNQRVGNWVDFSGANDIWQAHKLASWLYSQGDLKSADGMDSVKPGDILFFSKQNPEGAGTNGEYFANIYHTALYVGDGKVIHSYGPGSKTGVVEQNLGKTERNNLSFVARPEWKSPDGTSIPNDGSANDGSTKDGSAKDGSAKDGSAKDGSAKDDGSQKSDRKSSDDALFGGLSS